MGSFLIALALAAATPHTNPRPFATAPCTPTRICVGHNGSVYTLNTGAGHVVRPSLTLTVGTTYTFEADTSFVAHPFAITSDPMGGTSTGMFGPTDGISGTHPLTAVGHIFTYTPQTPQILLPVYYQCTAHAGMGNLISVVAASPPDMRAPDDLRQVVTVDDAAVSVSLDLDVMTPFDMDVVTPLDLAWTDLGFPSLHDMPIVAAQDMRVVVAEDMRLVAAEDMPAVADDMRRPDLAGTDESGLLSGGSDCSYGAGAPGTMLPLFVGLALLLATRRARSRALRDR